MRHTSVLTIAIGIAMVLLSAGGFASAATTTTGDVSESSSFVWTISSGAIDGVLVPGERQSTTVYGENTQATGGTSSYTKSFSFDTANKVQNQYNVDSSKIFTFDGIGDGTGTGRAISDEYIGIDTMGMPQSTSSVTSDPFIASEYPVIPAFHNVVNAGSSFDIARGSVVTQGQSRTVTPDASVPVALNYRISLHGLGNEPAVGSVSAFMNGHLESGRGNTTEKAQDIVFSQTSSASGLISAFDKTMNYESGLNRFRV